MRIDNRLNNSLKSFATANGDILQKTQRTF